MLKSGACIDTISGNRKDSEEFKDEAALTRDCWFIVQHQPYSISGAAKQGQLLQDSHIDIAYSYNTNCSAVSISVVTLNLDPILYRLTVMCAFGGLTEGLTLL